MAALSSESARTEELSPVPLRNPMCCYMAGNGLGGEGRAESVKLHQAIEARPDGFVKLGTSEKKGLGSFDVVNPFSYHPPDIGVNPVLGPFRPEILKKRTRSGITKVKKELGLKLACFRAGFFEVNFDQ